MFTHIVKTQYAEHVLSVIWHIQCDPVITVAEKSDVQIHKGFNTKGVLRSSKLLSNIKQNVYNFVASFQTDNAFIIMTKDIYYRLTFDLKMLSLLQKFITASVVTYYNGTLSIIH